MASGSKSALHAATPLHAAILVRGPAPGFYRAKIVCGYRPCAAAIGDFIRCGRDDEEHSLELDAIWGVTYRSGNYRWHVQLRRRYDEQWQQAKRRGVAWSKFRPHGRRPARGTSGTETTQLEERLLAEPYTPFSFTCPACGRENLADFPTTCTPDCQYHCQLCAEVKRPDLPHVCGPSQEEIEARLLRS